MRLWSVQKGCNMLVHYEATGNVTRTLRFAVSADSSYIAYPDNTR
jgi:hypothetical protein